MDKIETTTSALVEHFKKIEGRTTKLEGAVRANKSSIQEVKTEVTSFKTEVKGTITSNSAKIKDISGDVKKLKNELKGANTSNAAKIKEATAEIASLKETVEVQGRAIAKLTSMKADLLKQNKEVKSDLVKQNQETKADLIKRNEGITGEMNKLLKQQKEQVVSFQATTQQVERKILEKTEEKIEEKVGKVSQSSSFKQLRDQAFDNRHNVIIIGLEENSDKSTRAVVSDLLKKLGEEKINLTDAFRLGTARDDPTYHRPIKVKFFHLADRNRVWRKRFNITAEDGARKVKIQADLPKELREETGILYRISRAAAKFENYRSVMIRNCALTLHGKEYTPRDLESLPTPLRPSIISNPKSEDAIVFFTKYSVLSNHHHSPFTLKGEQFQNMEQFLATKKALLSGKEDLIRRAAQASDPKIAKAILHSLREDHVPEWDQQVEEVIVEGLRAKFSQNQPMLSFLKGTAQLQIGEASTNPRWGIGLDLDNPDVLDTTKWNPSGNLLGRSLMRIRAELCPNLDKSAKMPTKNKSKK